MQHKLKSIFRRSKNPRSSSGQHGDDTHPVKSSPPRGDRHSIPSSRHGRTSADSSATDSIYTGRSRPVSSIYADSQNNKNVPDGVLSPSDPEGGAIANDYKAYLPVLSPVEDHDGVDYVTAKEDRQELVRRSDVRHDEDVADRNIARYSRSFDGGHRDLTTTKSLAVQQPSRKRNHPESADAPLDQARTHGSAGNFPIDHTIVRNSVHNGDMSPTETHGAGLRPQPTFSPKAAQDHVEIERKPLALTSTRDTLQSWQEPHAVQSTIPDLRYATVDGTAHGEETALAKKLREDGVVDLRNTVDTDGNITWAPAVTHEVIKPHQHEIIQHKIHREIHNYEYFHRIQPVMMTEVLPPRHWIPNPNGEGLIEISADELPARTGDNRWWSICEHSRPQPPQTSIPKYRTEPEIIEAGSYMTAEGFERKETIIVYPPTLADLTGYGGPVQAMHFDHKTGKSWMGELTTMDKLEQLQKELDRAPDAQAFDMNDLSENLPSVSSSSARRGSNVVPPRKPVSGH